MGLFGQVGGEIRNLTLANVDVKGNVRIELLAGEADGASINTIRIDSSRIRDGTHYVGGLVGNLSAAIVEAVFLSADVSGWSRVGGVIGHSYDSSMSHVSFTGDEVRGISSYVGGLVGYAQETTIRDSIVLGTQVNGTVKVGGAVGILRQGSMLGSAALTRQVIGSWIDVGGVIGEAQEGNLAKAAAFSEEIDGADNLGGLLGMAQSMKLSSSLAVSHQITGWTAGSAIHVGGLIGHATGVTSYYSYWDSIVDLPDDGGKKTTQQLQSPTGYTDVYVDWNTAIDFDNEDGDGQTNTGRDDNTRWYDTNYDGEIDNSERRSSNSIWDFGTPSDYPTLRCTPITPQQQRSFINSLSD